MASEIRPSQGADLSRLRIHREDSPERAPRRTGPILIALFAVLVALTAFGWWRFSSGLRPVEVSTALVQPPDVSGGGGSILTASGYIVARRKAGVGPKNAGLLEYLGVEEGSKVTQGQIIGRLQHKDADADLAAARSSLDEARANFAEAEALLD
jgi:multidrug efflux pump subunit AcrA (membrane-fusion protein)